MTRSNFLIALLLVSALSGCATPQNYEAKMKSFIGLSEKQVVEKMDQNGFGKPIWHGPDGEGRFIDFLRDLWAHFPKYTEFNCHTRVHFRDGKAVSYEYSGDKCVAF